MGLLSKLVMLPLAPVGGVIWLAEQLEQQAHEQMYGPEAIRRELGEIERLHEAGEIDDTEFRDRQADLLERLHEQLIARQGGDPR